MVKLLLGFYEPTSGSIQIGNTLLKHIDKKLWRSRCGSVMQDGFIFSDTVAENIAESEDQVDREKLQKAVQIANIQEFIEALPLSYNTKVGASGNGVSKGSDNVF